MITENNKRFLRQIPFLTNLSEQELIDFFQHLEKPITLEQRAAICKEGSCSEDSYIVLEGQCDVYKTIDKKKTLVDQIKKTQVVGEMCEFLHGTRRVSVVVRSESAKLLKITLNKLPLPLRTKIRENQCRVLAERLVKKNDLSVKLEQNILKIKEHGDQKLHEQEEKYEALLEARNQEMDKLKKELKELRLKVSK